MAKRQGAHDYFLIYVSSQSASALATVELQEYLSAAAVAVHGDGDRPCRFVYWIAVGGQRRHIQPFSIAAAVGGS